MDSAALPGGARFWETKMGISIGLVGLGQFGRCFAPLFAAHPGVDSVLLCDAEESRLKKWADDPIVRRKLARGGCFTSFDDLCGADCDAIAIITQPWLHAPQAIQAMESGKHVYSAVPVISIPDDDECLDWCRRIIDCTLRTGRHYMLGETTWFRPQAMFCRRKFRAGEFGVPVYAEAEYEHDVDRYGCSLRDVRRSRMAGKVGAESERILAPYYARGLRNHPMAYPTHSMSGPLSVMDTYATQVSAYGTRNQFGAEDPFFAQMDFANIVALFRLANGVPFRVGEMREVAGNIGLSSEDFRLFGSRGSYSNGQWNDNGRTAFSEAPKHVASTRPTEAEMRDPLPPEVAEAFKAVQNPDAKPGDDFVPQGHGGSHPYLVHEFVSAICDGRRPAIDAWKAASYMAMGVAAHKSAMRDGEIVKVEDFGRAPRE